MNVRGGIGWVFDMNKGDLIGYVNLDGETEWGLVISEEPFMYRPSAMEDEYLAVTVVWPDDKLSVTSENIDTILSEDKGDSGIWLQSSLSAP